MVNGSKNSNNKSDQFPTEPSRVRAFASFFKRYMSVSSVVAAALPIPITAISLIPTYSAHIKLLSIYTPMVCFLLLGYIFFRRHSIGARMFGVALVRYRWYDPRSILVDQKDREEMDFGASDAEFIAERMKGLFDIMPIVLMIASISTIFGYHYFLDESIMSAMEHSAIKKIVENNLQQEYSRQDSEWWAGVSRWKKKNDIITENDDELSRMLPPELQNRPNPPSIEENPDKILALTPLLFVPQSLFLMILYIMFFAFAEAAFILMADKEYIQDLLRLSDTTLLTGNREAIYREIQMALQKAITSQRTRMHDSGDS